MTVAAENQAPARPGLSRQQILAAALDYVDGHGLEALSMHKLGAALGVKAMSLYKHVADKDAILDGIVDLLWDEIPAEPAAGDWQEAVRQLAASLRGLVHRHPHAAPLLTSRQGLREHPLRVAHGVLEAMTGRGVPEPCAVALLRTVFPYGIGFALAELSLPRHPARPGQRDRAYPPGHRVLSPQASDEIVRTALLVCGDCDMTAQFHIGVDLMIRGLDAYLATLTDAAAATPR